MVSARVPLLLLPGTLCTGATFAHQLEHLADVSEPRAIPLTDGDGTGAMAEAILASAPERFALAGFSQGAIVAFEMVRRAPERIERLALLHANARPPTEAQLALWEGWRERVAGGEFDAIVPAFGGGVYDGHERVQALRHTVVAMAREIGPDAFARQLLALADRPDSRPTVAEIACPTLILGGRHDGVVPPALLEELHAAVPHALAVPIEGCGHYGPLERPEAVTAALRLWLQLR